MIIDIYAIETSGLDAQKDVILEVARMAWHTGGKTTGQSWLIDPGDIEFSDEIIEYHKKTGLLDDLITGPRESLADVAPCAAHLRIVWQLDFARPFIAASPLSAILSNAIDARSVLQLARVLRGVNLSGVSRAGPKAQMISACLTALHEGPDFAF